MKVVFSFQNDNYSRIQNSKINFEAGLTPKMIQEIKNADVLEISKKLANRGIDTDFKGHKIIAWGSQKTIDIIEQLNSKFGTNLSHPTGIYVEDFANLNTNSQSAFGFCNMTRTYLKKNSKDITPEKTIFFNTFRTFINQVSPKDRWLYDWRYLSKIADKSYAEKFSSTDHFLDPFFHEFGHLFHIDNMINEMGSKNALKKLELAKTSNKVIIYNNKYGDRLSQICDYAKENPPEAIASDISKHIADSLEEGTLNPIKNPFKGTPYENLPFKEKIKIPYYLDEERPLVEILRDIWNGKFD